VRLPSLLVISAYVAANEIAGEKDCVEMTQTTYQPEERERLRRRYNEQAIALALKSQWEEAVEVNQKLLALIPQDLSTLNRLGKALSELGRFGEAKQAYAGALEVDPANNIARKNFERLSQLAETDPDAAVSASHERIDPRLFIEETGKTGFTQLVELAPREVIARLTAGDQVYLDRQGALLYVNNAKGTRIGRVEPRLAGRLIKFMEGGNQYAAGITELERAGVRIIIRETYQAPDMFGKVSFPAHGGEVTRGYIKDTMLRYDYDEESSDEDEFTEEEEEAEEEGAEPESEEPESRESEE